MNLILIVAANYRFMQECLVVPMPLKLLDVWACRKLASLVMPRADRLQGKAMSIGLLRRLEADAGRSQARIISARWSRKISNLAEPQKLTMSLTEKKPGSIGTMEAQEIVDLALSSEHSQKSPC